MTGILASSRVRRSTRNLLLITTSTSSTWKMNSALFNHDVDYQYVDNTNGNVLYSGNAADLGFAVDLSIGNGNTSLVILDRELGYDIDTLDLGVLLLNTVKVNFLPSLIELYIDQNNVSVLDITKNTNLLRLACNNNNISVLDVTQNIALLSIGCIRNNISVLNFSQATSLRIVQAASNSLTSLNIKNGNNTNMNSAAFYIEENPDLECVLVDDVAYANENFTRKDAQTNYSETTCP